MRVLSLRMSGIVRFDNVEGNMSEAEAKLVRVSEAARLIGVSSGTLRNWDRSGRLRTIRHPVNGYRLYATEQLLALRKELDATPADDVDREASRKFPDSPRRPAREEGDLGQHMTPLTVALQMASFVQRPITQWRVIDPACGDGNLLIAAAERLIQAGIPDVANRICGVDVDEAMVAIARRRLAEKLKADERNVNIRQADFLAERETSLFAPSRFDLSGYNVVLSNPPYGRGREYAFFEACASQLPAESELVFLMPLSFIDRIAGVLAVPLEGRPLGVTTGHAIVRHVCGKAYSLRSIKEHQQNCSSFLVLSGVKLYELGAGDPPQTADIIERKPYSSSAPRSGWLPCLRTGDVKAFSYETGRLFVKYGPHLAHPKELARFQGPRLFVRRVPVWQDRQMGAAYAEDTILCAGDVLVIRHKSDEKDLLKGLCKFLNSPECAEAVLARRPSMRYRDSFPKLSAKDLNALFDQHLPSEELLRELSQTRVKRNAVAPKLGMHAKQDVTTRFIETRFPVQSVSEATRSLRSDDG